MIKVALPNKGALFEPTLDLLNSCGYRVSKAGSNLSSIDPENNVEFYFLRPGDIPLYISNGILDAGITGRDFVSEQCVAPTLLRDLNYGHSRLCAAVPEESKVTTLEEIAGLRIATSLPNIVRRYFSGQQIDVVELEGAVEISVRLGIAEAVVDVVDTGSTLRQAGLRIVGEPLFQSNAALYANPDRASEPEVEVLLARVEGKLVATEFMMVEYDCPGEILADACIVTPGIESPTVTRLQREGWYSVKAMVPRKEAHHIMDTLSRMGCRGILLTTIESARI
ncbi:MAG: ATP phosphoribosyltransferase [Dehalococcoidia bacterium]|jgi:ATP phosphoribosyltransferase|nr:ATP phosphoribosyltransferase [Tepidiformaceae bacterium]